jgi:hypothetical protein
VAVCHIGHGLNSYFLSYHLVSGHLAYFVSTFYGGMHRNARRENAIMTLQFDICRLLLDRLERLAANGELPDSGRLVAIGVDSQGAVCGWLDRALPPPASDPDLEDPDDRPGSSSALDGRSGREWARQWVEDHRVAAGVGLEALAGPMAAASLLDQMTAATRPLP